MNIEEMRIYATSGYAKSLEYDNKGHREKSEAPGRRRKMRPPAREATRKFRGLEIS